MAETGRELTLDDFPRPPLFKLVDPEGRDVFQQTEVGGESARVGVLFSDRELAGEFSAGAARPRSRATDAASSPSVDPASAPPP